MGRKLAIIGAVVVGVVVIGLAGVFIYARVTDDDTPAKTVDNAAAPTDCQSATSVDGSWTVSPGSEVGYQVEEELALGAATTTAQGRTSDVTGSMTINGTTVSTAEFTAQMDTVKSSESRRDNQFRTRIMDVAQYPTASFTLTSPIDLGNIPSEGEKVTTNANGNLTIRGVTQPVTVELHAQRAGCEVRVDAQIPIEFADFGIPEASFPPAGVSVRDNGLLNVFLAFRQSA